MMRRDSKQVPVLDYSPRPQAEKTRVGVLQWLVLGAIVIVAAAVVLPASYVGVPQRGRPRCLSNLRQIGAVMRMYANEHRGMFRAEPEVAIRAELKECAAEIMQCPAGASKGNGSFTYMLGHDARSRPDEVLAYEPLGWHEYPGGSVLFVDGRVRFLNPAEHQAAIARTNARLAKRATSAPAQSAKRMPDSSPG